MAKIHPVQQNNKHVGWMTAECPGCGNHHYYSEGWTLTGTKEIPTFTPSYVSHDKGKVCHSFLTNGRWIYLSDCTHDLKGKTMELPEIIR